MTTVVLDPKLDLRREQLILALKQRSIDVRPFFYPLSAIPAYRNTTGAALARERNRVSYEVSPFGVNLPSALSLTREDVTDVCNALRRLTGPLACAETPGD